jgi:TonB-dependent starch-binding outer membrane protein SusC
MQEFATRKPIAPGMDLRQPNCLFTKYRMAVRIMKLTTILLTVACLQLSARGLTQNVTISVKDAPLLTVLKAIKKQTGFVFYITSQELKRAKNISITAKNLPLEQVLDLCFKDQPLTYIITGKLINIIPRIRQEEKNDKTGYTAPLPANIDVSGKVTDGNGAPLVGANVVEKGKQNGTTTNGDGVFLLKGVDENGSLVISYVGFQTLTVPVNSRSSIIVSIKPSDANLQEVVINKGYYTELKKFSTGNIGTITSKDIEKQPVQNPLLALQGRVPGVVVTQMTGINGGAVQVRIQGRNSITAGLEPLIIIDGIPFPSKFSPNTADITQGGSPLNYINPLDIESISVLKDADATSIYGSRAANGAILITTKKGKAGKPKLSVDVQQGWGKVTRHVDMMNTRQYLDMRYEALKNDGLYPDPTYDYDLTFWDSTRYTNWQKELIGGKAQYTNVNAGVTGGTDLVQYLVGANYNRLTTVFPGNFANKTGGLHFSLSGASPKQKLRIQLSGSYNYTGNSLPFIDLTQSAVLLEPNTPKLFNEDGSLNWAPNASGSSTWVNPLASTFNNDYSNVTKNLYSNLNISYTLLTGLTLSSNFGYNSLQSDVFSGLKLGFYAPEYRASSQRSARFSNRSTSSWIIEPQLQFAKNIGKSKLEALIGFTIQKSTGNYLSVYASGQPTDELLHSLAAATTVKSGSSANNNLDYTTRFNGLFCRIGYNWDSKYLVNLTGRRDGSSKFGKENRFHNFWSVGAGWIFSEEKFLNSSKSWLSLGKIRASYGTTGNDQIADYSYLSLYNILNTNILYQGTTSFNVAGLSNPFLQWEETRKLQGGIDLSLLNERIVLGVTYASNRSSNQLVGYALPGLTGFTSYTKNFPATIQNTSWEFSLNTINIKSKSFNWSTNFNLTIPRSEVISFPGIELTSYASGGNGVIVGEPIGIVKTIHYGGVDPATGYYYPLDTFGKPIYYPNNANGSDYTAKVSLLPKYYGGINNTISYKGFQLDFLFQFVYQMGSKDMYYTNQVGVPPGGFAGGLSNQPITALNHWQKPGDNAPIGRYNSDYSLSIWPTQSDAAYSYAAGSYIRLKNASLSWQLPDTWSKSAHLQTARIYFRGQNLATITGYKGLDPETRDISTLPPLQIWTVGAKVEL